MKLIISGVSGRIGKRVLQQALNDPSIQLIGGTVSPHSPQLGQDLSALLDQATECGTIATDDLEQLPKADAIIDFSSTSHIDSVADYCVLNQTALISGTTGLSQTQFDRLSQAAKFTPVMWTSNFSLNVQIIKNLLQIIEQTNQANSYQITETHHLNKLDSPSGTAISLAQAIEKQATMTKTAANSFQLGKVQINAIRQGQEVGTHQVKCNLDDEIIEIKHQALNPNIFAQGAIQAAKTIYRAPAAFYDLNHILFKQAD